MAAAAGPPPQRPQAVCGRPGSLAEPGRRGRRCRAGAAATPGRLQPRYAASRSRVDVAAAAGTAPQRPQAVYASPCSLAEPGRRGRRGRAGSAATSGPLRETRQPRGDGLTWPPLPGRRRSDPRPSAGDQATARSRADVAAAAWPAPQRPPAVRFCRPLLAAADRPSRAEPYRPRAVRPPPRQRPGCSALAWALPSFRRTRAAAAAASASVRPSRSLPGRPVPGVLGLRVSAAGAAGRPRSEGRPAAFGAVRCGVRIAAAAARGPAEAPSRSSRVRLFVCPFVCLFYRRVFACAFARLTLFV